MGETSPPIANPRGKTGRFVLLVQSRMPGPMKLLEGLRKRDAAVRVVHDSASAMVEVAQFNAQVLIVHEPEAVGDLESLLAAVRLYHPGVLCWRHEAGGADRRENLSPFACKLNQTPAPRFTPAPQSLNQPASLHDKFSPQKTASHNSSQDKSSQVKLSQGKAVGATSHDSRNQRPPEKSAHGVERDDARSDSSQHVGHKNEQIQGVAGFTQGQSDTEHTSHTNGKHTPNASDTASIMNNGHVRNHADLAGMLGRKPALSLGHRLATPLDALDDLTAGPLLSAEEIELLRGPQETDDA